MHKELAIGDLAPEITLPSDSQESINISDYKGKNIVIYFYPKDDTPGCTIEAKDFSCNLDKFTTLNTIVIGISRDSVKKHQKFRDKHELKHILLSDETGDKKMCQEYGVWVEKSMYGKKYMGIARTTFLIDTNGIIAKIWPKVKIEGHVEEVLKAI